MALQLTNISGSVLVDDAGLPANEGQAVADGDYIWFGAGGGGVTIFDPLFGGAAARVTSGTSISVLALKGTLSQGSPNVSTYKPPTLSLYLIYYRYSYRWQLKSTGGATGIRV